jgi:hypothetical protein
MSAKRAEDGRKYVAEGGLADSEAIDSGMQEKRNEWS